MLLGSKVRYNLLSSFLEASSTLIEGRLARNSSGISLILFFETTRSSKLRSLVSTLGMEVIWLLGGKREEGRGPGRRKKGIGRKGEERRGRRKGGRGRRDERGRGSEKGREGRRDGRRGRQEEGERRDNGDMLTLIQKLCPPICTTTYSRVTKCLTRIRHIQVF